MGEVFPAGLFAVKNIQDRQQGSMHVIQLYPAMLGIELSLPLLLVVFVR